MPSFELTILGTSSSQPAFGRFPTCQILQCGNNMYMIDCGEASQIQLSKFNIKRSKIKVIFISHLHGDHIYGLPGVITSFMHYNRKDDLTIIGPHGIQYYVEASLAASQAHIGFTINFKEYDTTVSQQVHSDEKLSVMSVPLNHGIPTMGFLFKENVHYRKLDKSKIEFWNLDFEEMKLLKSGQDISREDGTKIYVNEVCLPKNEPVTYAFISDTKYDESIIDYVQNVDVLYHETTYLHDMDLEALQRFHSTSTQAATIAKMANAGKLITGHYSSRYKSLHEFEEECKSVFENTILGMEGLNVIIDQK